LLRVNGSSAGELDVYPQPGVPYMYLPKDTCDAIANHLPVTYSPDFNLYLWNTEVPAYTQIVSSPHSLVFSFSSGSDGEISKVNVPFAVLNLTLESPLMSSPTPYFPCSPWTPDDAPYHLGRAFLQAAFLAQNFQTNKLFLAQAPGPDFLPKDVKNIASTDSALSPAPNAPDWDSTWATTLKALSINSSTPSPSALRQDNNRGLSGGAIAGIVIGCVAMVLAVAAALSCWIIRRKIARHPLNHPVHLDKKESMISAVGSSQYMSGPSFPMNDPRWNLQHEMDTKQPAAELDSSPPINAVELSTESR